MAQCGTGRDFPRLAGVTNPRNASQPATQPNYVWVYGNDHSPWVQAVLLGLHQKKIAHTLVTVPPLSVFLSSGILMPAARIDDGPWLLDSERILVEIGFSEVDADARRALLVVFGSGAMRRADDAWSFWYRFSYARDGHPVLRRRLWNQFWRSFSIFYFFTLITMGRRARPRPTRERLARGFSFFQERLQPGADFLGGGAPDTVDLQLFGLVQMCASIPGPSLAVLREDPSLQRLREWVEAMQRCFSDYAHLYSAREFEPRLPEIERASALERFFYWSGAALMWIAFPITLPTALYLARRVRKKGLVRP
jgi:glutathione S-transferase